MLYVIPNPDTGVEYRIRAVPMDEALKMKAAGQVFYDFTKLTAVNTCPTWGVLRYALHKTDIPLTASGRMMAVECGKACHDYYAALRLWTLGEVVNHQIQFAPNIYAHGIKLFGAERMASMCAIPQDSDRINNAQLFALDALHSTGYYDDPSDRKRTMSNMEAACLAYTHRYFQSDIPVFVQGDMIGVEIPFVLEVMRVRPGNPALAQLNPELGEPHVTKHYYCGRIDGVHHHGNDIIVGENKTASRLSDSWRTSFAISAQVTGYTIAGTALLGREVNSAIVMGSQIPPPRDVFNGTAFELCTRTESDRLRWCEWFFHSIATYERYVSHPTKAPRYSHSCNRYFSACQFIPFCSSTREEQLMLLEDMRHDEWSPLDHLTETAVEGE